jgi:predicted hydrocarbon binding protein
MKVSFDPNLNIIELNGVMVSLHCHHYNCGLIRALEEMEGIQTRLIIIQAATEEFYMHFSEYIKQHLSNKIARDRFNAAADLYRFMGFGRLDLSGLDEEGGMAYADSSYYVVGWLAKYGRRDTPVCYLTCGFLNGVLSAVYERPIGFYNIIEQHCMIAGHNRCEFIVSVNQ